jgi:hypothetical protein
VRVGDPIDSLLTNTEDYRVRRAAIAALDVIYDMCAGEFHGAGEPAGRQMSGESIDLCRAVLQAALDAIDEARQRCPSGPRAIGSEELQ